MRQACSLDAEFGVPFKGEEHASSLPAKTEFGVPRKAASVHSVRGQSSPAKPLVALERQRHPRAGHDAVVQVAATRTTRQQPQ